MGMFPHKHGHIMDDFGFLVMLKLETHHMAWVWWYYDDFTVLTYKGVL